MYRHFFCGTGWWLMNYVGSLGHEMFSNISCQNDELGCGLFRSLGAVAGASLSAVRDSLSVKFAADDVIADTRQILDPSAADHYHGVFLQVVAFSRDIGRDFDSVGQAHSGDFAESGVRFFRGHGRDFQADAPFLGAREMNRPVFESIEGGKQGGRFALSSLVLPRFPY